MFGAKSIRIWRMERARKRQEQQIQEEQERIEQQRIEEQKRLEEEKREREYEEALKKAKKLAPEFLLTISTNTYVEKVGKTLNDYEYKSVDGRGFHKGGGVSGLENTVLEAKKEMIEKAKKLGAEVIVDVKPSLGYSDGCKLTYFMGTALILKNREAEK